MGGLSFFPTFDGLPQVATISAGAVGSGRLVDLPIPTSGRDAIVYVQNVKDHFRWNPTDTTTADGKTIVALLANGANPGRFERMGLAAPEWMQQATWYIDPTNGNDENSGAASNLALATDAERQRRMGQNAEVWPLTEYHLRVLNDLPASDPINIRGKFGPGNVACGIFIHGSATDGQGKAVLFTGTVDAVTAANHPTNVHLSWTSNALPVSWTASGLLSQRIRFTGGANVGAVSWVASDLGAKTANCIEPQVKPAAFTSPLTLPSTNTFTPSVADGFVVESLTTIAALNIDIQGFGNGSSFNGVFLDSVIVSTWTGATTGWLWLWGSRWNSTNSSIQTCRAYAGYGCTYGTNARVCVTGTITLVNCWAPDDASGFPLFQSSCNGSTALRFTTWQRNGCAFISPGPGEFSTAGTKAWLLQSGYGIFNNTAGPGLRMFGGNLNASEEIWGVCGAGGTPIFLHTGTWLYYRALPPGNAGMYYINVASAPSAAWISFMRDQAAVTSAPVFDTTTGLYTAPRLLTPANLQATIAAGGFNGKFCAPDVDCGMTCV